MAGSPLSFHFDFISPYGWFASRRIEALAARHGREVDWQPMLLGVAVMKVMGLKPLLDTPLKGDYVRRDVQRTVRRLGLHMQRDIAAPMGNPLPPARALCWVRRHRAEHTAAVVHALYRAYWEDANDFREPQALATVTGLPTGVTGTDLAAAAAGEEAATLLRDAVAASLAAGIFGSPMVVADGEPFWGHDRLDDADAWLAGGGW